MIPAHRVFGLVLGVFALIASAAASPRLELSHAVSLDAPPRGPIGSIERLSPRDTVYIEAQATNRGIGPAVDVIADVFVNDVLLARVSLGTLLRGQTRSVSVPWWPSREGAYAIRVVLDPDNRHSRAQDLPARERRTSCVIRFLPADLAVAAAPSPDPMPTIAPSPRPDLRFFSAVHVLPHPRASRSSLISAWVENAGAAPTVASTVEFHIGGVRVATRLLPVIRPGQRTAISLLWNPEQPGPRPIRIVLDPENRISETDEGNNVLDRTIEVERL